MIVEHPEMMDEQGQDGYVLVDSFSEQDRGVRMDPRNRPRRDPLANRPRPRGPRPPQGKRNRGNKGNRGNRGNRGPNPYNKTLNFKRAQARVSQAREVQSRLLMKRRYDHDTSTAGDHGHSHHRPSRDSYQNIYYDSNIAVKLVGGEPTDPVPYTQITDQDNYASYEQSPINRTPLLDTSLPIVDTPTANSQYVGGASYPTNSQSSFTSMDPSSNSIGSDQYTQQYNWQYGGSNRSSPSVPTYLPDDVRVPSLMEVSPMVPTNSTVFNRLGHTASNQYPVQRPAQQHSIVQRANTAPQGPTVQLQRPLPPRMPRPTVSDPRLVARRESGHGDEPNPRLPTRTSSRQISSSSRQITSTQQRPSRRRAPLIQRGFRSKERERERKKGQKIRSRLRKELANILDAQSTSTPALQRTPAVKNTTSTPGPELLPTPAFRKELPAKLQSYNRPRGATLNTNPAIRPVNAALKTPGPSHALTTAVSELASHIQQVLSNSSINSRHVDTPDTFSHQVNSQVIVIDADEVKDETKPKTSRDHNITNLLSAINDGISSFVAASKQITDSLDSLKNIMELNEQ